MYLRSATIRNIRSIKHFELELEREEFPGWHVLLGDNGAGKSTFVRSIALAFVGPSEAVALRQSWADWLRKGEAEGTIEVQIDHNPTVDKVATPGKPATKFYIPAYLKLLPSETATGPAVAMVPGNGTPDPWRYIWGQA